MFCCHTPRCLQTQASLPRAGLIGINILTGRQAFYLETMADHSRCVNVILGPRNECPVRNGEEWCYCAQIFFFSRANILRGRGIQDKKTE